MSVNKKLNKESNSKTNKKPDNNIKNKLIILFITAAVFTMLFSQTAFAITESEVQAKVNEAGKEAVAGNVFVWFLCAVAFLKVSQKIDSFMSSLGINVGHTGGSLMAEAVITARGIGTAKSLAGHGYRGSHKTATGGSGPGGAFLSGGLAGVVSRNTAESARRNATGADKHSVAGIGGRMYASSVRKGGDFANSIIGTVAAGNIGSAGTITGGKAAEALHSYLGYAAMEPGAADIPQFSGVEIGGGRITGTETSEDHPGGIAFGMYHTGVYAPPDGSYSTIQTKDGANWYKQYAADKAERTPFMAPDGSIAYKESIVKKLPPPPPRKERL